MNKNKVKCFFQAEYVKALYEFKAKRDVRVYLTGFNIKPHFKQGVIITASDGYTMVTIHDKYGFSDDNYTLPLSATLKSFASKIGKSPMLTSDIVFDGETLSVMLGDWQEAKKHDHKNIAYTEYVDLIERPNTNPIPPPNLFNKSIKPVSSFCLNPAYMARCAKAVENPIYGITFMTTGFDEPIIACAGKENEIVFVFMPIRQHIETEAKGFLAELLKRNKGEK